MTSKLDMFPFRFDSVMDILQEFYVLRLKFYFKRKDYLEGMLDAEAKKLSNQAKFIEQQCDGNLTIYLYLFSKMFK